MKIKKIVTIFVVTYFFLFLLSWVIVTIVPVFAFCIAIVHAACQTGNVWVLTLSLLPYTGLLAAILSPFIVKYFNMKQRLEEIDAASEEEADADR